jgi:hypothetical protein
VSFSLDYEGVGELLRGPEMQAVMVKHAEAVKARAEATAPVDTKSPHPGRYKESFAIESGVLEAFHGRGGKTERAFARVVNTAPEAILVEYGSRNNQRHRTLGRALGAYE